MHFATLLASLWMVAVQAHLRDEKAHLRAEQSQTTVPTPAPTPAPPTLAPTPGPTYSTNFCDTAPRQGHPSLTGFPLRAGVELPCCPDDDTCNANSPIHPSEQYGCDANDTALTDKNITTLRGCYDGAFAHEEKKVRECCTADRCTENCADTCCLCDCHWGALACLPRECSECNGGTGNPCLSTSVVSR
jgi:hypothetical protein